MNDNETFLKNDVKADNQVSRTYHLEGINPKIADIRVMFIGNSITYHEIKDQIGWHRNAGMAASDIKNDYVHLIYEKLNKEGNLSILIYNAGQFELDYTNEDKLNSIIKTADEYDPHIVIIRIGENFNKDYLLKQNISPYKAFDELIKGMKANDRDIIVTSLFWHFDLLDKEIEKASKDNGVKYARICDFGENDENKAIGQYDNEAVANHPNDLGMRRIAERILDLLD